jgi:ABC-type iron transport system FetAB ATPase subunit
MALLRIDRLQFLDFPPLDLELEHGECITVTGQSGAGKSLLLRAIADLDPHSGALFLEGQECSSFAPADWRKNICLMPSENQWWSDTVIDHFPGLTLDTEDIANWLTMLHLDRNVLHSEVSRLSTGEKQRLSLIRVLVNKPKVLLLDEPTASLDLENTIQAERIILTYIKEHQAGAIWISHNPEQAKRVGNRHFHFHGKKLSPTSYPTEQQ